MALFNRKREFIPTYYTWMTLIEIYCSFISCIIFCISYKKIIWNIISEDSIQMEKWDPSTIIETPFPSLSLAYLTSTAFFITMAYNSILGIVKRYEGRRRRFIWNIIWKLLMDTILLSIAIWITFFLCGMHPLRHNLQNIWSCLYVTCLLLCPHNYNYSLDSSYASISLPDGIHRNFSNNNNNVDDDDDDILMVHDKSAIQGSITALYRLEQYTTSLLNHLLLDSHHHHQSHNIIIHTQKDEDMNIISMKSMEEVRFNTSIGHLIRRYCILFMVIISMILRVLDHGLQIQRWPLPIIVGSTFGFILGSFLHIIVLYCV